MLREQAQQQRAPPPAYVQHEPDSFHLPPVPTHHPNRDCLADRLPGIKSLDLPPTSVRHNIHNSIEVSPRLHFGSPQWGALPCLNSTAFPKVPEGFPYKDGSPMDATSVLNTMDDGTAGQRETSLSIDDPDVRLAAEALSGLGNPDFIRSQTASSHTLSVTRSPTTEPQPQSEPLLSLITSNHPWLGGTINGSISAYKTTKGYTPRFVQYGAQLIERNIGSPMVNTVSSVGRRTGMEKNIRRYLGEVHGRSGDLEAADGEVSRAKRQKITDIAEQAIEADDEALATQSRDGSLSSSQFFYAESLPAYDNQRSPNYEETVLSPTTTNEKPVHQTSSLQDRRMNWPAQLIMTTSGLGIALSDASLRSLKLCLRLLRNATTHIDTVMRALHLLLEEYDAAVKDGRESHEQATSDEKQMREMEGTMAQMDLVHVSRDGKVQRMAERIKALASDIWTTLQRVVQSVSRYTGGALPQNASSVVRSQLLSVPRRWQLAGRNATESDAEKMGGEEIRSANRMLAFAKEGLDMMSQITTVVDGTVQSAESWLSTVGKKTANEEHASESSAEREKTLLILPSASARADEKR